MLKQAKDQGTGSFMIVDVRDAEEVEQGHLKGSINRESKLFAEAEDLDAFIDAQIADEVETVVVHCHLSQIRGPKAASRWVVMAHWREADLIGIAAAASIPNTVAPASEHPQASLLP